MNAESPGRFHTVPLMTPQHVGDEDRFQVFHVHGFVARNGLHAGRQA